MNPLPGTDPAWLALANGSLLFMMLFIFVAAVVEEWQRSRGRRP